MRMFSYLCSLSSNHFSPWFIKNKTGRTSVLRAFRCVLVESEIYYYHKAKRINTIVATVFRMSKQPNGMEEKKRWRSAFCMLAASTSINSGRRLLAVDADERAYYNCKSVCPMRLCSSAFVPVSDDACGKEIVLISDWRFFICVINIDRWRKRMV